MLATAGDYGLDAIAWSVSADDRTREAICDD
jgi:hypothetical protein